MKLKIYKLKNYEKMLEVLKKTSSRKERDVGVKTTITKKELSLGNSKFKIIMFNHSKKVSSESESLKIYNNFKLDEVNIKNIKYANLLKGDSENVRWSEDERSDIFDGVGISGDAKTFSRESDAISTMIVIEHIVSNKCIGIYAITFGYAFHYIDSDCIDKKFPLDIAGKINIDSVNLSTSIQPFFREAKTLSSYKRESKLNFGLGRFLTSLDFIAKDASKQLGFINVKISNQISASENLAISILTNGDKEIKDKYLHYICEIILYLENKLSGPTLESFSLLARADESIVGILKKELIRNRSDISTYFEHFSLKDGTLINYDELEKYDIYHKDNPTTKHKFSNELLSSLISDADNNDIEHLEYLDDLICDWEGGKKKFNVFDYLSGVVDYSGDSYVLSNSSWYKIENDITDLLEKEMNAIDEFSETITESPVTNEDIINEVEKIKNGSHSQEGSFIYLEAQYNTLLSQKDNYVLLDRLNEVSTKTEIADYAHIDNDGSVTLSSVKCGLGNDGMSKNINQSITTIMNLSAPPKDYIEKLKEKGIEKEKIKKMELVYLVDKDVADGYFSSLDDHTISRFLLSEWMQKCKSMGFKYGVKFVNISEIKETANNNKYNKKGEKI